MNKGFTLSELLVTSALAVVLIIIIVLSAAALNKASLKLYRKYEVAMSAKIMLKSIAKEIMKNYPYAQTNIISVQPNYIEFYAADINQNNDISVYIVSLQITSQQINNRYRYAVRKVKKQLSGNIVEDRTYDYYLPTPSSNLRIENMNNICIRIYLENRIIINNRGYNLNYKYDVPINGI
ncbi:MAG: hypothetical protein ABDH21_01875 [bacterium]